MKSPHRFIALFAIGIGFIPVGIAQIPEAQSAPQPVESAIVPVEQQPTNEQLAKLFDEMRIRQQLDGLMKQIPAMLQQQIKAQTKEMAGKLSGGAGALTPDQQAAMDKLLDKYMTKALKIYPVDEMLSDMASLYKQHLNRTDVDAFIAFYATPAAQHLLDAQPAIMQEYVPLVMSRMQERSKQLRDEMAKDLEEFAKSSAANSTKPAGK